MPKKIPTQVMIAIAAGKGGVGKSTLAVNLALALKKAGKSVGLIDADVYGPSLDQMIPMEKWPSSSDEDPDWIIPGERSGLRMISTAHFSEKGEAAIIRAPVANSIIDQFLNKVQWGALDFLIVDFPPGTGDVQLTLMQKGTFNGAVLITTPQEVALLDVRKAAQMFQKMHIPLLGIVENMSYFEEGGKKHALFGSGGGAKLAQELGVPLLGRIPLDPKLSEAGDKGGSIFEMDPKASSVRVFEEIAAVVQERLAGALQEDIDAEVLGDGRVRFFGSIFSAQEIQSRCPCARCRGQGQSRSDVGIIQLQKIGRYAVKMTFTSGCSQGMYARGLMDLLK